jgi:hypothetical protein
LQGTRTLTSHHVQTNSVAADNDYLTSVLHWFDKNDIEPEVAPIFIKSNPDLLARIQVLAGDRLKLRMPVWRLGSCPYLAWPA